MAYRDFSIPGHQVNCLARILPTQAFLVFLMGRPIKADLALNNRQFSRGQRPYFYGNGQWDRNQLTPSLPR